MSDTQLDVVGIGNAIVDVLARAETELLEDFGLTPGSMNLIDSEQADALYAQMGPAVEVSGGSAANTIAGIAGLGGKGGFIGKVANDQLGSVFTHDIQSLGVQFETPVATTGAPTAVSYILVTPDGQRTMNTYLGACQDLSPDDVDPDTIRAAQVTYLEGYLWDPPGAKEAFLKAIDIAHQAGRKISLTLSDMFCVDRYRIEFLHLLETHIDILFANDTEVMALYGVDTFEEAVARVRVDADVAALTRSADGSVILTNGERFDIAAAPATVEDTTGAGDLYAAGFLYGFTQGMPLGRCGEIASLCAGEIISHVGARAEVDLKAMIAEKLG